MKLISMTDFLPEHPYSNFLKQPLELWMFDENDERCLFEGWKMRDSLRLTKGELSIEFHDDSVTFFGIFCDLEYVSVIEDLVKYNLQIKQLGL